MTGRTALGVTVAFVIAAMTASAPLFAAPLRTPLERAGYMRLPDSADINTFLRDLAAADPRARIESIGRSAGGRELLALRIAAPPSAGKLTVMIVGSQHGQEPSGAEAVQQIARDLLQGPRQKDLAHLNLVLVPLANPDGRDTNRRVNGANVNLSTAFVLLTQPESRALARLTAHDEPDVVLDVHESAALKKKSLGAQGYLIDFQAQFDCANNPDVDPRLRRLCAGRLLTAVIAGMRAQGVVARHYIGEVTDIHQTVTHAGLSIRNLRNYAGLRGAISLLMENQLDPPGTYDTPRNIKGRVRKQYIGIETVLARVIALRRDIRAAVDEARAPETIAAHKRIAFDWQYAADAARPTIRLPMRRLADNTPFEQDFKYTPRIVGRDIAALARAYVIEDRRPLITQILDRHGIRYRRLTAQDRPNGAETVVIGQNGKIVSHAPVAGDLEVNVAQAGGLLVPLLLDPRSANSIFRYPPVAVPAR